MYKQTVKQLPEDVNSFETVPETSIYYKTIDNENFLYYKNNNVIIFQSNNLAKIQLKYGNVIFCDATFKSCPSFSYQIFITRVFEVFDFIKNSYYTTSFSIMKNKRKED